MDETTLKRAVHNAWILTVVAAIFVIAFFTLTVVTNSPARPRTWNLGGTPFVPASDVAAQGYFLPVQSPTATGVSP